MAFRQARKAPPPWFYSVIVVILGATLLIGVVGWFVLVTNGYEMPDSLGTILSTIAGGLVGALTMSGSTDREPPGQSGAERVAPE
jgi:hypothetical protein